MTFKDEDFELDVKFDPDDVDIEDLVEMSLGIHGVMCPQVYDYNSANHYVVGKS